MNVGYKLYKDKVNNKSYADMAVWCNNNNAHIEDKGDYFEVVENEPAAEPTTQEKVFELEKQIENINMTMVRDLLIIADDEQTTEKKQEAKQYLSQKKIQKNDLIGKINKLREV
ncbi:MAG: hypothetical protein IKO48_07135 [Elusimicrobia bacterium]|nr:hypothetical protein [Elusimicrobiota bacterium]